MVTYRFTRSALVITAWSSWLTLIVGFTAWLCLRINTPDVAQAIFLPGPSTNGHHQIETDCAACHAQGGGIDQAKCLSCHEAGLTASLDSHPQKKFSDPRNADRLTGLNALACITCHVEHQPGITTTMGVTLPVDYCFHCHAEVGKERPSHIGLPFSGCLSNGCHNYHDNRALNESFLEKHLADVPHKKNGQVPSKNFAERWRQQHPQKSPLAQLLAASDPIHRDPAITADWHESGHARSAVGCADCHQRNEEGREIPWVNHPSHQACVRCHTQEVSGWLAGKHGMRLASGLSAMTPSDARLPMHTAVAHQSLSCSSCHSAHRSDTVTASAKSCLQCHADEHSRSWEQSPHGRLWNNSHIILSETTDKRGASCATCHMPRLAGSDAKMNVMLTAQDNHPTEGPRTVVIHNQNAFLRPREKMAYAVCLKCHGLSFTLDALADDDLIQRNFSGLPSQHIPGIDWVRNRHSPNTPGPVNTVPKTTGVSP